MITYRILIFSKLSVFPKILSGARVPELLLLFLLVLSGKPIQAGAEAIFSEIDTVGKSRLSVATFDLDVTPPVGYRLPYNVEINKWDLGLRAKGMVLIGAGKPIVLCALDWIDLSNEGMVLFKKALATAAGTTPERVTVHTLHPHDAPGFNPSAEKIMLEAGLEVDSLFGGMDGSWGRKVIPQLAEAVKKCLQHAHPVDELGLGKAAVREVASNRTVYRGADGKVIRTRFSSTGTDTLLRKLPEGTIDSIVSVISFWNKGNPVAVLSFYATHPQSYYLTGVANPDFVGVARFFRQLEVPDALHIHFNGASGDVAAGKYNDGSHINRLILARRLADGMKRAWDATQRQPITASDIDWWVQPVLLPPHEKIYRLREKLLAGDTTISNSYIAEQLAWLKRYEAGITVDCSCLKMKNSRILFMPGELFVEYQLRAKAMRPDLFVAMSAYGDRGMGYIGTAEAYRYGGYETERASKVSSKADAILMEAVRKLLSN